MEKINNVMELFRLFVEQIHPNLIDIREESEDDEDGEDDEEYEDKEDNEDNEDDEDDEDDEEDKEDDQKNMLFKPESRCMKDIERLYWIYYIYKNNIVMQS